MAKRWTGTSSVEREVLLKEFQDEVIQTAERMLRPGISRIEIEEIRRRRGQRD